MAHVLRHFSDGLPNIAGSGNPSGEPWRGSCIVFVEFEPTGPFGMRNCRVGGNDFQVGRLSKPQQKIVSPHSRVLAPRLRNDTESPPHEVRANFKRRCRNDKVIDVAARVVCHPTLFNFSLFTTFMR
jgi:hypothetical protein